MNLASLYDHLAKQYGSSTGEMVFTFSDKGSMHSYIGFYEKFFEGKRQDVSLLEIGMMTGGSMHLWQQYFEKYSLVGIDISKSWNQQRPFQAALETDDRIELIFGVNSRIDPPPELADRSFDFIIDDGDHSVLAQIDTFVNYWPLVKPGGTYFIEDVVGPTQAQALKNFLQSKDITDIEHYLGLKNNRADDQIIAVTKGQS